MACYNGPNPVNDEDRLVIWRWAKENGIDQGVPIEKVAKGINDRFFGGMGRIEWITDIISGRKTPYRVAADDFWRKQHNRRVAVGQAEALSKNAVWGPAGEFLEGLYSLPRSVSVAYHFTAFPLTHGGDLAFNPEHWRVWVKGTLDSYHGAFSKAYAERMLFQVEQDPLYRTAVDSGLTGVRSHPIGILPKFFKKITATEASERSWQMLSVMRFHLWKSQFEGKAEPLREGMSSEEAKNTLDFGKKYAEWANNATGAGKGWVASAGEKVLFGPALTQSKINRIVVDPIKTTGTFGKMAIEKIFANPNWEKATPAEKAVAWLRLRGATQYVLTRIAFLAVNQAVLSYFGSKQQVNWKDPNKSDWMEFKGYGLEGYIPGMQTELHMLAKIVATQWMSNRELRGASDREHESNLLGQYEANKFSPTISLGLELFNKQDWMGRPLPFSSKPGTPKRPKLTWTEYLGSHAPIPMEGPIKYVYEQLKKNGASSADAMTITKGLIITGLSLTAAHVQEEPTPTPAK